MIVKEKAYAKVNLVLNVLNKRDDGFHEVDFLMNSLELCDDIKVELSDDDDVIVENSPSLNGKSNLAYEAIKLMKAKYGLQNNYKVKIVKRIPIAAGMAGGSSDAAAVIRAINIIENLNLELKELEQVAEQLGSDVPYCLYSRLARATARGEKIELIDKRIENFKVVAVNPGVKLSTQKVFANYCVKDNHQNIEEVIDDLSYSNLQKTLFNNLEDSAQSLCPQILELKSELSKLTNKKILLSGSGPTVFVIFNSQKEANMVYDKIRKKYHKSYITKLR